MQPMKRMRQLHLTWKKISKIRYLGEKVKMEEKVNCKLQCECKTCIYTGIYTRTIDKKLKSDCLWKGTEHLGRKSKGIVFSTYMFGHIPQRSKQIKSLVTTNLGDLTFTLILLTSIFHFNLCLFLPVTTLTRSYRINFWK